MNRNDWTRELDFSKMKIIMSEKDGKMDNILLNKLKSKMDENREERDKNINRFQMPFLAENNDDYEKKLKEKLDAFVKEIDRPAFRKEGILVKDVKNICNQVKKAFYEIKIGNEKESEKIVANLLEGYKKSSFAVSDLDKSCAFRGGAAVKEVV